MRRLFTHIVQKCAAARRKNPENNKETVGEASGTAKNDRAGQNRAEPPDRERNLRRL